MRLLTVCALVMTLIAGCSTPSLPLVRDGANLFGVRAEAEAEQRLRGLGERHGVWVYIISEVDGDPPRMLDEPMSAAEADGLTAIALLFNQHGSMGSGYTRSAAGWSSAPGSSAADGMIQRGESDAALEVIVDHIEVWIRGEAGEIGN
jgi:hypothetical protein